MSVRCLWRRWWNEKVYRAPAGYSYCPGLPFTSSVDKTSRMVVLASGGSSKGSARMFAGAERLAVIVQKPLKPKKCKVCPSMFLPSRPMQKVCGPLCALDLARAARIKQEARRQVLDRRETKAKLKELQPRKYWLARAKVAIQAFRRLEELAKGSGCMSCGRSQSQVAGSDSWKPGGLWDGGHFLSKGARPELALEPLNIWLQCKSCNGGSSNYARKGYTVNASFEANLIEQKGQEMVDWLKGPHEAKHYDADELQALEKQYSALVREMKGKS